MSRVDVTNVADVRAVLGSTGTGKSHYVKAQMGKARRLLVWDIEDEYDLPALPLSAIAAHLVGRKPGRYKFVCSGDAGTRARQFDLFCRLAFELGNVLVVVEELRFVTLASRAPEGWAMLTLRGRKRGIKIIGTSQRPAQIDKDFLGNCNYVRCGALEYPEDRKAVAPVLRCSVDDIAALTGYRCLEWRRPA
jgi:DNA helicase HerA-like ATPase